MADSGREELHLTIRGRVQGVGFRAFTRHLARSAGISGWVRNRADGAVEVVAAGEAEAMERFVAGLEQGPPAARVSSIERREPAGGERPPRDGAFEITY